MMRREGEGRGGDPGGGGGNPVLKIILEILRNALRGSFHSSFATIVHYLHNTTGFLPFQPRTIGLYLKKKKITTFHKPRRYFFTTVYAPLL